MFNFFKTKLPIDLTDKAWIEYRWSWLCRNLGAEVMRNAPMLTLADFPELSDLTEQSALRLFQRISAQLKFPANSVALEFLDDSEDAGEYDDGSSALGFYEPANDLRGSRVVIATSLLQRPAEMVSTMAHELGHHLLLVGSGKLFAADEYDHEYLTDLVSVFTGFGLFTANCTVQDHSYTDGQMSHFHISKSGYLSSIQFGYALGLMAWMRNERSPKWINQLRPDAKVSCRNAIRYLMKTGDAFVQPDSNFRTDQFSKPRRTEDLVSQSSSVRLATLIQWQLEPESIDQVAGQVVQFLDDPVEEIRVAAIRLFTDGNIPLTPDSKGALVRSLSSSNEEESLFACQVLFERRFAGIDELVRRSRFWFEKSAESDLARLTYVEILESLPEERFHIHCQVAIVNKTDRDLRQGGDAEMFLTVLRKVPDLEAVINQFFNRWSEERQQDLVYFRDTGQQPVQR